MDQVKSRKRLNIDRWMAGILSFVAILGACLVLMVVLATNSLSGLRAFSSLQTFWTETRKDAANDLIQYIHTGDPQDLNSFYKSMEIIERATNVKDELIKDQPDRDVVYNNMRKLHVRASDINDMVNAYRRYYFFTVFEDAIVNWEKSDSLVYRYYDIAHAASGARSEDDTAATGTDLINRVEVVDEELDQLQYRLASYLGEGASLLNRLILGGGIFLGSILLIISGILSFRFMKSIKRWSRQIRESKQRYKSLFEQNPHAVFSMDRNGKVINGNSAFTKIFKNEKSPPAISHFSELFVGHTPREIQQKLDEIKQGTPLNFEVKWQKAQQQDVYLHCTIMPIIVQENVVGMFGIAEDITFEKKAERQIKQQLEEKTILLAEIHHRVKNNLAIISGLLELQQDSVQETAALRALGEAQTRIQSIAMIHEKIYQNESLADINFRKYIEELAAMIANSFNLNDRDIEIHIDAENVAISLDQSIPCGLILNELVCNACEHAFSDQDEGNIWITCHQKNREVKMTIADDGEGLPGDWEEKRSESLGLTLVQTLASQLDGTWLVEDDGITRFEIIFEKVEHAEEYSSY